MSRFQPGTHIGPHKVRRFLASGERADVYEVIAPEVGRAALKLLRKGLEAALKAPERLEQEAEAIAGIEHVNVVRLYCGGEFEGHLYLVIELVEGPNLRRMMKEAGGALPIDRVVSIVRQACDGLAAAHRAGVLHRDLKPEDILMTPSGVVKIVDFGSSKLTLWGVVTTGNQEGISSLYVAPEILAGRPADANSDVFSLGTILYEAIAGVHPLRLPPATPLVTIRRDVPGKLSDLVQRALAWEPADRCSLSELADRLDKERQHFLAPRRNAARNVFARREEGFARTERAIPIGRTSISPAQRLGPGGTIPLPVVGGRPGPLPPEPADRIVTKRSPPVATPLPVPVTMPMAEVTPIAERRTTAPRRWMPWAAGGVAAVLGLGLLGAGWVLATRDGETRTGAVQPPAPARRPPRPR